MLARGSEAIDHQGRRGSTRGAHRARRRLRGRLLLGRGRSFPARATTRSPRCASRTSACTTRKDRHQRSTVGNQTTAALLQALEEREPELRDHLDQVAGLSVEVGREMGITGDELDDLARAAHLHDVGKVAVPDAILQKPSELDPVEWELMKNHAIAGERILSAAPALSSIATPGALQPRALGRRRLPRRHRRRGDPAGRPHHRRLRRLPLDDHPAASTAAPSTATRRSRSCAAAPATSSIPRWSRRSAACAARRTRPAWSATSRRCS